jgi:hypothetical protein
MRHRKKLIAAALLFLAGGYAILCFWPHSNPEAVRALAALRGMIQTDESGEAPVLTEGKAPSRELIACEVVIATINMTDAQIPPMESQSADTSFPSVKSAKSVDD